MNEEKTPLLRRDGTVKLLASLLSIVIGLVVGGLIVLFVGLGDSEIGADGAWEGLRLIFAGILSTGRSAAGTLTWGFNPTNVGNMLFRAMPVIMTGLSVAVAFKTGLFNIGAPGQYLMSTMVSLIIALGMDTSAVPAGLVWLLAFLGGLAAGALWGCIPGLVKAFLNINEVLACIMTNWIAANLVTWVFDGSVYRNVAEGTKSGYIYKTSFNGVATPKLGLDKLFPGSQVNAGILIAVVLAVAMYILMNKTTLGYELKACGANRHAARYAGISDKRNIVFSMAIADIDASAPGLNIVIYAQGGPSGNALLVLNADYSTVLSLTAGTPVLQNTGTFSGISTSSGLIQNANGDGSFTVVLTNPIAGVSSASSWGVPVTFTGGTEVTASEYPLADLSGAGTFAAVRDLTAGSTAGAADVPIAAGTGITPSGITVSGSAWLHLSAPADCYVPIDGSAEIY